MKQDQVRVRVHGNALGSISEQNSLFAAIEDAYNSSLAFDILLDSRYDYQTMYKRRREKIDAQRVKEDVKLTELRLRALKILKEGHLKGVLWRYQNEDKVFSKDATELLTEIELILNDVLNITEIIERDENSGRIFCDNVYENLSTAMFDSESSRKSRIVSLILPEEYIYISKVQFSSPGFWEFLGKLNPLETIREYLKDRHIRVKDKKFAWDQEKRRGELEIEEKRFSIIEKKIRLLKQLGYTDTQIREMSMEYFYSPLGSLNQHIDTGRITDIEFLPPDDFEGLDFVGLDDPL